MIERKSAGLRVLVAEDELLTRWSIAESLAGSGHTVVEASDASAAIRALTETPAPIDVVLLDYKLEEADGLVVLAAIRRIAPFTPVVMMTVYWSPELALKALQLGACEVVAKPFDMDDLASLVSRAYGQRPH
ncbi:MAG TPA: response regulator [Vicinamibacterales bacterium]|jgi:DNA-binding NtrC family response regulator|nr:response regulator [Vicinamibacterales bacterium]